MDADKSRHWDAVYQQRPPDAVSWFQPQANVSLRLIQAAGLTPGDPVIDVGGGASVLVDALLSAGHQHLTVVDLSQQALDHARARLGERAESVRWIQGDITQSHLPARSFALWHDRAVFHFLTEAEDRARYICAAQTALRPGGLLVMGTFAEDGPLTCSQLPVARYDSAALAATVGASFALRHTERELHLTPSGARQAFTWCVFQRVGPTESNRTGDAP